MSCGFFILKSQNYTACFKVNRSDAEADNKRSDPYPHNPKSPIIIKINRNSKPH